MIPLDVLLQLIQVPDIYYNMNLSRESSMRRFRSFMQILYADYRKINPDGEQIVSFVDYLMNKFVVCNNQDDY